MSIRLARRARIVANLDPLLVGISAVAVILMLVAAADRPSSLEAALRSTAWPFATLAGIIALGVLADRAGAFGVLTRVLVPARSGPRGTAAAVLTFAVLLSALTNLDVAAVVAMPVALGATGGVEGSPPSPWLAAAVAATVNASSFLLPTSNATTLLILSRSGVDAATYVRGSWLAWLLVSGLTVGVLALLVAHGARRRHGSTEPEREPVGVRPPPGRVPLRMLADLVPLFFAAAALRTLVGEGIRLHGGFAAQAGLGSTFAAAFNNLPVAAALYPTHRSSVWPEVLAMAIGPNLLLWGSLATLLCRRIAVENGRRLEAWRFSVLGAALLPVQFAVGWCALRAVGAV